LKKDAKQSDDPAKVRDTLLNSARQAGPRYLRVRGIDLETAITGQSQAEPAPVDNKQNAGEKK
jgi:hypothetical protein